MLPSEILVNAGLITNITLIDLLMSQLLLCKLQHQMSGINVHFVGQRITQASKRFCLLDPAQPRWKHERELSVLQSLSV